MAASSSEEILSAESLEADAAKLRAKISPIITGHAHLKFWIGRGKDGMGYLGARTHAAARAQYEPADLTEWLGSRGMQQGEIRGDGKCQYRAFSRGLFGHEEHHDELRSLAVKFLKLHKNRYQHRVAVTELRDRKAALKQLQAQGSITDTGYDGWCEALEYAAEWGQDFTLQAMCLLMHTEARVVHNLERQRAQQEPRIMTTSVDPTTETGCGTPKATIYLVLSNLHYTTLEEKPEAVPPPETALVAHSVSFESGSMHTDEHDPVKMIIDGTSDEEIRFGGVDYSAGELLTGVPDGERHILLMEIEAQYYVLYRVDMFTGAREEVRRIDKRKIKGPPRQKARQAEETAQPVEILEDDVSIWLSKLKENGYQEARDMAQKLGDAVSSYIDLMSLNPSSTNSELHIDRLGTKMHEIQEKLKLVKLRMFAEATSEDQPQNKVLVVGDSGAGKSSTINAFFRAAAKPDADLASANPPVLTTSQSFSRRFALEPSVNEDAIKAADEELKKFVFNKKQNDAIRYIKPVPGDLLPAASAPEAMTALVTKAKLDPEATAATLRLTYRSREEVDEALTNAEKLRASYLTSNAARASADDDVEDEEALEVDFDAAMVAYMVCDMVGGPTELLTAEEKAEKLIGEYKGEFKLKPHQYDLLGRQRDMTVAAPTFAAMASQLHEWLVMHTIGKWSNWAIIKSVELIIPSDAIALMICDVPGFGVHANDPYRQSIVAETMTSCECSTMLFCLKWERLKDANHGSQRCIDESGVCEQLFGEPLTRRLGKVLTMTSLDWALKASNFYEEEDEEDAAVVARNAATKLGNQSKHWLQLAMEQAAERKGVSMQRVNEALNSYANSIALDVRGAVERHAADVAEFNIKTVLDVLVSNAKDHLRRRQQVLFKDLVFECLLPFVSELNKIGAWRTLQENDTSIAIPKVGPILKRMKIAGDDALVMGRQAAQLQDDNGPRHSLRILGAQAAPGLAMPGQRASGSTARDVNSHRAKDMCVKVMGPYIDKATDQAVTTRFWKDAPFESGYFESYRTKGSRALGNDLKSSKIELSRLKDLAIPEVVYDTVVPLQDCLRGLKEDVLSAPLKAMHVEIKNCYREWFQKEELDADDAKQEKLSSLQTNIFPALEDELTEQEHTFDADFTSLLHTLSPELTRIVKSEFSRSLSPVANARGNPARMKALSKRAHDLAKDVSKALVEEYVLNHILEVLHNKFHASFETICKNLDALLRAVVAKGESKDFERLKGFALSQHYLRFCAGMVSAIQKSGLEPKISAFKRIDEVCQMAEQPHDIISKGEGLSELYLPPPPAHPLPALMLPPNAGIDLSWHCPMCGVHESDTNMDARGAFSLRKPCGHRVKPDVECWCEAIPADERSVLRCKLCVNYFINKHRPRARETEKQRMRDRLKRQSLDANLSTGSPSPKVQKQVAELE